MKRNLIAFSVVALFASGGAFAAGQYGDSMDRAAAPSFDLLDTNEDGVVSREEAAAYNRLSNNWERADDNASGTLDRSEFSAFQEMLAPEETYPTLEGFTYDQIYNRDDNTPDFPAAEP